MAGFDPDAYLAKKTAAPSQGFDPDAYLAKKTGNEPTQPAENPHDLAPFLKNAASGIWEGAKDAASGVGHAIAHPLDTATDLADWMLFNGGPAGGNDTLVNERTLRSVPVVGPAYENARAAADPEYLAKTAAEDAQHAAEHPVLDKAQKLIGGSTGLLAGPAEGAGLYVVDAYHRSRLAGNDTETALKDARNVAALIGAANYGGQAIKQGASLGGDAAAWGAKRVAKATTGITPEAIDEYLARPEAIRSAEKYVNDPELLKNEIDSSVAKITGPIDTAKNAVTAAKEDVSDAKIAARYARAQTDQSASEAFRAAKEGLDKTGAPEGLASNIVDSLNDQGDKLSKMSGNSFDILANEGQTFKVSDLDKAVAKQMNTLKIGGVEPKVGPDAAAYNALGQFRGMLKNIGENSGGEVEAPVVKRLIQTLDSTSKAAYETNAGELGPEAAVNLASVRHNFNSILRDSSPAYAEQMDKLAPQVKLVSEMSKVFGNEQKAMSALRAAGDPMSPQGFTVRKLLNQYDETNGTSFTKDLKDFFNAKETLKSPTKLAEFKANLPESKIAAGQLPEEAALEGSQSRLDQLIKDLEGKKLWGESVSKLGPNSTENAIKTVRSGRGFETEKQLANLDEIFGTNHLQNVKDSGIANQFSRPSTNGSRKTVLGGTIGAAVGAFTGHPELGVMAGSAAGFLADTYGGQAVKTVLDAGIAIDRLVGTKFIDPIMKAAQRGPGDLAIAQYTLSQSEPGFRQAIGDNHVIKITDPDQVSRVKDHIKNDPNMSNIDKAKQINEINKNGYILVEPPPGPIQNDTTDTQSAPPPPLSLDGLKGAMQRASH